MIRHELVLPLIPPSLGWVIDHGPNEYSRQIMIWLDHLRTMKKRLPNRLWWKQADIRPIPPLGVTICMTRSRRFTTPAERYCIAPLLDALASKEIYIMKQSRYRLPGQNVSPLRGIRVIVDRVPPYLCWVKLITRPVKKEEPSYTLLRFRDASDEKEDIDLVPSFGGIL